MDIFGNYASLYYWRYPFAYTSILVPAVAKMGILYSITIVS